MAPIKTGDKIEVVTRDVTTEDAKNGLYFSYFGGLTGIVDRIYDDGSVCIDIDLDSLTADMRERHQDMQETERQRWLANLSDEARNRLNGEQKKLKMSYKILVSKKDIEPDKGGKPRNSKSSDSKGTESRAKKADAKPDSSDSDKTTNVSSEKEEASKSEKEQPSKRLSEADLSAAEEAFLRSRQST